MTRRWRRQSAPGARCANERSARNARFHRFYARLNSRRVAPFTVHRRCQIGRFSSSFQAVSMSYPRLRARAQCKPELAACPTHRTRSRRWNCAIGRGTPSGSPSHPRDRVKRQAWSRHVVIVERAWLSGGRTTQRTNQLSIERTCPALITHATFRHVKKLRIHRPEFATGSTELLLAELCFHHPAKASHYAFIRRQISYISHPTTLIEPGNVIKENSVSKKSRSHRHVYNYPFIDGVRYGQVYPP